MKNLLKLKYDMHKGVNYLFYIIIIVIGILIGLGLKKIGAFDFRIINDFISKIGG